MKDPIAQPIKGRIFRKIKEYTEKRFYAEYKGMCVWVEYMDSGLYEGKWNAEVWSASNGIKDVDTLYTTEEAPTIEDAIALALKGACI